jgi:hypothetical protein
VWLVYSLQSRKPGHLSKIITAEDLSDNFHLPINDVARKVCEFTRPDDVFTQLSCGVPCLETLTKEDRCCTFCAARTLCYRSKATLPREGDYALALSEGTLAPRKEAWCNVVSVLRSFEGRVTLVG